MRKWVLSVASDLVAKVKADKLGGKRVYDPASKEQDEFVREIVRATWSKTPGSMIAWWSKPERQLENLPEWQLFYLHAILRSYKKGARSHWPALQDALQKHAKAAPPKSKAARPKKRELPM